MNQILPNNLTYQWQEAGAFCSRQWVKYRMHGTVCWQALQCWHPLQAPMLYKNCRSWIQAINLKPHALNLIQTGSDWADLNCLLITQHSHGLQGPGLCVDSNSLRRRGSDWLLSKQGMSVLLMFNIGWILTTKSIETQV